MEPVKILNVDLTSKTSVNQNFKKKKKFKISIVRIHIICEMLSLIISLIHHQMD